MHLPVGEGAGRFDVAGAPGRELLDAGLVTFAGHGEDRLAAGLYRAPRRLLRATFTARSGDQPTTEGLLLPPPDSIAAGVEFRMIYDAQHASDRWGLLQHPGVRAGR